MSFIYTGTILPYYARSCMLPYTSVQCPFSIIANVCYSTFSSQKSQLFKHQIFYPKHPIIYHHNKNNQPTCSFNISLHNWHQKHNYHYCSSLENATMLSIFLILTLYKHNNDYGLLYHITCFILPKS